MKSEKIKAFQGVRGLAILMIMFSHAAFIQDGDGRNCLGHLGGGGVEIFLLLSGFLTSYWYLDKVDESKSIGDCFHYSVEKIKKYYPLHIITLLLAIPFAWKALFLQIDLLQWLKVIVNLLLLQSWVPTSSVYFSFNAVSWYLSVMFFILLVSNVVLMTIRRISKRANVYMILLIGAVEFFLADSIEYLQIGKSGSHWLVYVFPVVRLMDFVCGGGVYVVSRSTDLSEKIIINRCLLLVMIVSYVEVVTLGMCNENEFFSVFLWYFPSVLLIYLLAVKEKLLTKVFENKLLVFFGNISFELFLIHQLFIRYYEKIIGAEIVSWDYIVPLVLSSCIAALIHYKLKVLYLK